MLTTTIRFFIFEEASDNDEFREVDEATFIEHKGSISYERHTVFLNGVNQVVLTKGVLPL